MEAWNVLLKKIVTKDSLCREAEIGAAGLEPALT